MAQERTVLKTVLHSIAGQLSPASVDFLMWEFIHRPEELVTFLRLIVARLEYMSSEKRDELAERIAGTCDYIFHTYDARHTSKGATVLSVLCELVSELVEDCPEAKTYFKATSLPLKMARSSKEHMSLGSALRDAAEACDADNVDEGETQAEGDIVSV